MKLLLDTHIWIWAVGRPDKLSREVRRQIDNPRNELYLSPVSIWEAYNLSQRKRVLTKPTYREWLSNALMKMPVQQAPFNFAVAEEACKIHLSQPDPGDLFIAATASMHGMTLVTADAQMLSCAWLKTIANP